ncbi:MAG: nif-specific transcriptional activator NifA [Deltaproteobacteria bacterium]|nr:nif-specific transcriptional activator NifA [Deltaproteobacteria bacterium]
MHIDRKTSREIEEITCLYEIARALGASLDLRASLHSTLDILAKKLGMTRGTITILNPMASELQIEVAHGLTAEARKRGRYKLGEGITGKVVESGQPMVVPRISEEPLFLNRTRSRGNLAKQDISFICVPIKAAQKTVGALSVDRLFQTDVSLDEDLRLLTIISSLIAQTVTKIQTMEKEKELLINENLELRHRLTDKYSISHIVGNSSRMKEVYEMISRVAESNATVLIRGESGTGKELVANALHYNSRRAHKPFIKVNCSALPETLIESELFGHEKGAFTGAIHQKKGRFELAEGGSIFLDEVGELSQNIQVKLLRVIQEHEFERLGGTQTIHCDVRIIAATNKDLEEALNRGTFREDLYYRLNVFPIHIPPLRERRTDILLLAEHFLERFCRENNKTIRRISTPAIDMLMQYHWPGNVRELGNCIERAVLLCNESALRSIHLPPTLQTAEESGSMPSKSLDSVLRNVEKEIIIDALKSTRGNIAVAARLLGTTERILGLRIKKYGFTPQKYRGKS